MWYSRLMERGRRKRKTEIWAQRNISLELKDQEVAEEQQYEYLE